MTHWAACRVDSISEGSISTQHIIWTLRKSCHMAVRFLGLTDTVKSKVNIWERKIVNDQTERYGKKKSRRMIIIAQFIYEGT